MSLLHPLKYFNVDFWHQAEGQHDLLTCSFGTNLAYSLLTLFFPLAVIFSMSCIHSHVGYNNPSEHIITVEESLGSHYKIRVLLDLASHSSITWGF